MYYCYSVYSRKNKLSDDVFLDEFPDLLDVCNNPSVKCIIQRDTGVHFAFYFIFNILKHFFLKLEKKGLPRCYVPLNVQLLLDC